MAIQVNFVDDGIGVELLSSGVVTGVDVIKAHAQVYHPAVLSKLKYLLIDRSACEKYFVSTAHLKSVAELSREAAKVSPGFIVAITSPTDLMHRAAEVWKSYLDKDSIQVGLFGSRNHAIKWIETQLGQKTSLI